MVSEAPSEEASLSDVFLYISSDLASVLIYKLHKFSWGLRPPPPTRGPCSIGSTFFPVHVIILPVAAKSININSILIILIIFIMLLNFNGLYWRRAPPPPPLYLTLRLGIYLQKLNTFLFKFGGSSTPH